MSQSKDDKAENSSGSFWSTLPGVLTGIATVIGAITTLILGLKEVGIIGPIEDKTQTISEPELGWVFVGFASTGEGIYVDDQKIQKSENTTSFVYKIGNDFISASTSCSNNQWQIAGSSKLYSPQSKAAEKMLEHVCKF